MEQTYPIIPEKTAMLFFDCLNIYLHPEDAERAAAVQASGQIRAMQRIYKACREAGIVLFYGQADHRADGKDFWPHVVDQGYTGKPGEAARLTTAPGVVGGSWGAEIIAELPPEPQDYVIKKHRWSTFFQTHMELSLRTAGIDTLMLAGGSTEIGIASTAYSARDMNIHQIILRDACRSGRPGMDDFLMEKVFPGFCRVMTVDEAIAQIAVPVGIGGRD
jgi:nicotinamidase-related amidase